MTDISELERQMLTCNKKCEEHDMTQEIIHGNTHCISVIKDRLNKVALKVSWLIGILFLAGVFMGYGLNSIHSLETLARKQEGTNQSLHVANLKLPSIIRTQNETAISITKIQQDIKYIQKDLKEIKTILNKRDKS